MHAETNLKSPQRSVIGCQFFIKCLSFLSFGRHVLNLFYIMYIVKLVKHFSLFQVFTLCRCKRFNCYFYTFSTIALYMWFFFNLYPVLSSSQPPSNDIQLTLYLIGYTWLFLVCLCNHIMWYWAPISFFRVYLKYMWIHIKPSTQQRRPVVAVVGR
jgi:hypothetical protein